MRSGAASTSGLGFDPKDGSAPNVDGDLLNTFSGSGSRHVITAGTAREKAFQVTVSRDQGHSVFTQAFLDALAAGAQASNDRGFVILDEVFASIKLRVGRFTSQGSGRTMTPKLWPIPRDDKDKGTFVFLNPAARNPRAPEGLQKALAVVPKDGAAEPGTPIADARLNMAMLAYQSLQNSTNLAALRRFVSENENVPGAGWMVEIFKEKIRTLESGAPPSIVPVLRAGQVRTNPDDGQPYVWIPPGEFQMGCSPGDKECDDIEKPLHKVKITRGFWLGQTELTVGAYKQFAQKTGVSMPGEPMIGQRKLNHAWSDLDQPMVAVTWAEAKSYCKSSAKGRLPTEAEWEYAARAASTAARYGELDAIAWYAGNSGNSHLETQAWEKDAARDGNKYLNILEKNGNRIHRVKQKQPNPWNLHDMLGNVREWVSDWYQADYYKTLPSTALDPEGPTSGTDCVLRGGSWYWGGRLLRVSDRNVYISFLSFFDIGFRCAREVISP
ncbi:MAG: formylglycine-generating enzyme family protein [Acidobacteria bacterium]|nr:formylglycine-generating enzyme family protein [Acidobacteriota bacterium]